MPLTYRVIWSEEDNEYVGLCDEYPRLSHLDPNPDRALAGIQRLVEGLEDVNPHSS